MHFIKDIVALSALLAIGSSSIVKRADEHDLKARGSISIVVTDDSNENPLTGIHATSDCDDNSCSTACYQHGGAVGGSCDDKGKCICDFSLNQIRGGNHGSSADDIHTSDGCQTYSDCLSCYFYERCCWKAGGNTGTGVCLCGTSGRESECF